MKYSYQAILNSYSLSKLIAVYLADLSLVQAQMNRIDLGTETFYGGAQSKDRSGYNVRFAGDVDGDGNTDFLIGEFEASPLGRTLAGQIRLVWGPIDSSGIFFHDLQSFMSVDNVLFYGSEANAMLGSAVGAAGDVDNDGYDDILLPEPNGGFSGYWDSGRVSLWFGRPRNMTQAVYDLAYNPLSDFDIVPIIGNDDEKCGYSVAAAGDMDKDGYNDILIGCRDAAPDARDEAGRTYLCYGRARATWPVNANFDYLLLLDDHTINECHVIDGYINYGWSAYALAAGDVNNDTYPDAIIGAPEISPGGLHDAGIVYIYFGGPRGMPLQHFNLMDLHNGLPGGAMIRGVIADEFLGVSFAVGDVDGDGIDDILVGAEKAKIGSKVDAGAVYLYHGRNDWTSRTNATVDPAVIVFKGFSTDSKCGKSVSLGNANGDQYADIFIGCYHMDNAAGNQAGRIYAISGRNRTSWISPSIDLSLTHNTNDTLLLDGASNFDKTGRSVSSGYDIDGDGIHDLLVSADKATAFGRNDAGKTYFIPSSLLISRLIPFGPTTTPVPLTTGNIPTPIPDMFTSTPTLLPTSGSVPLTASSNPLTSDMTSMGVIMPSSTHGGGNDSPVSLVFIMAMLGGSCGLVLLTFFAVYWYKKRQRHQLLINRNVAISAPPSEGEGRSRRGSQPQHPSNRRHSLSRSARRKLTHSDLEAYGVNPDGRHSRRQSSIFSKETDSELRRSTDYTSIPLSVFKAGEQTADSELNRHGYARGILSAGPPKGVPGYGVIPNDQTLPRGYRGDQGNYDKINEARKVGDPIHASSYVNLPVRQLTSPGYDRVMTHTSYGNVSSQPGSGQRAAPQRAGDYDVLFPAETQSKSRRASYSRAASLSHSKNSPSSPRKILREKSHTHIYDEASSILK